MPPKNKRSPDIPFYRNLGNAIRTARSVAGKSQSELAEHIDVSFQQMQKYESGKNRIPVDRLVGIADCLEVSLSQLVSPSREDSEFQALAGQFSEKEFHALATAWISLRDRPARAALINLVKCMAALSR